MTIRIAYIVAADSIDLRETYPGVLKKTQEQANAFTEAGMVCDLLFIGTRGWVLSKVLKRLPFVPDGLKWDIPRYDQYDCVYVRKPDFISADMIRCLKKIKRERPDTKILLEIPTYPYDRENCSFGRFPVLLKDLSHRRKLHRYVDRIVDLSGCETIFNIPTLQVVNGVDMSRLLSRNPSSGPAGELNVICAAAFAGWHGVDRFLAGLKKYKQQGGLRKIRLHLLGTGPALPALKKQVDRLGLSDSVVFYGQCNREQVDEAYDKCQFAIECLGCHRKGLSLSSSLKSREYLAKGIPFIYSGEIDVFRRVPVDFCMKALADESPIDVERLIEFSDRLYGRESEEKLIDRIRKYAEDHIGMDIAMKNAIDYIKESCDDGQ